MSILSKELKKSTKSLLTINNDVLAQIKNQKIKYQAKNPEIKNFNLSDTIKCIFKEYGLWDDKLESELTTIQANYTPDRI
jgi:hypothetical protein